MLKVLELFGGIGACTAALKRLDIDFEVVDYVEIDKFAVRSYNAINNTNYEPQDVQTWDKDLEVDLVMHGSPCFPKGTMVNTSRGFKPIEDVSVNDVVVSHDGKYHKVEGLIGSETEELVSIVSSSIHEIKATPNHPFLVLRNNELQWVELKNLKLTDYLTVPRNTRQTDVEWNGVELNYNGHTELSNSLPFDKSEFWYVIGRFIGDGWITRRKERNNNISGIKICCNRLETDQLKTTVDKVFSSCLIHETTVDKIQIVSKELGVFCSQFGVGAENKVIPQNILDLKTEYLKPLLDGIVDSDGCFSQNKYKVTTISERLAYSLGELVLKVTGLPYHIYKTNRPHYHVIEDRVVNQKDTFQITWGENYNSRINWVDDNYLYSRVRKLATEKTSCEVYNLEVSDTHSYCVNNVAVHNCQDFSVAGLQKGGNEGSGTRSSLMYETLRIVEKLRPKYVIWENVKNVLSDKHRHNFDNYLSRLTELGYTSFYDVLNAKDFGIPQNRERVFVVSVHGDYDFFLFPEPTELKLHLKDLLDDEVDDRFYLSDKAIERMRTTTYTSGKYDNRVSKIGGV